jgi:hypothetical protein
MKRAMRCAVCSGSRCDKDSSCDVMLSSFSQKFTVVQILPHRHFQFIAAPLQLFAGCLAALAFHSPMYLLLVLILSAQYHV